VQFPCRATEEEEVTYEPVDEPATTPEVASEPAATATATAIETETPAAPSAPPRTGPLRVLSIIVIVVGAIFIVAGVITWFVVRDQLAAEKIVVSEDAPFLGGWDVDGPFTAYAEAEAINDHALEASGGLTYAELDREDPTRETVMTASFLRASLFTSVVAFGVAFFAFGIGIVLILIGWALLRVERSLRWSPGELPVAA
jgi:hypothetical protein